MNFSPNMVRAGSILVVAFGVAGAANAKGVPECTKKVDEGVASWYGTEMAKAVKNGKYIYNKTASGDEFSHEWISAAHRTIKLGTYVRVQRTDTGQSLVLKINDRGPFKKGRMLDLSEAAAEKLDVGDKGVMKVAVFKCDM